MIFWVDLAFPGRLAIMPRPRSGDWLQDDLSTLRADGVGQVVSLLTREEARELGLDEEPSMCRSLGIEFDSLPISDRGIPESVASATALAERIAKGLRNGRNIAIHCRMGIGRAPLMAACALLRLGVTLPEALNLLSRARGYEVPETDEQRRWLASFADSRGA